MVRAVRSERLGWGFESLRAHQHSKRAMLFLRRRILELGLDLTLQLQRQRVALTVACVSRSHPYPPFADAIFLHIGLFYALEANASAPLHNRRVMIGAARGDREPVGREGKKGGEGKRGTSMV